MISEEVMSTLALFIVTFLLSWSVHDYWDNWNAQRRSQEKGESYQIERDSYLIEWQMCLDRLGQELAEEKRMARIQLEEANRTFDQAQREISRQKNIAQKAREELTGARKRFNRKMAQLKNKGARGVSNREGHGPR